MNTIPVKLNAWELVTAATALEEMNTHNAIEKHSAQALASKFDEAGKKLAKHKLPK